MFQKIVLSLFILLALAITNFSQSGRKIDSSNQVKNDETAQISCEKNPEEYKYIVGENAKDFLNELNLLGKCGYRLDFLTKFGIMYNELPKDADLFAIVKLDTPNQYEYGAFEAGSSVEAAEILTEKTKKGFNFKKSLLFSIDRCGLKNSNSKEDSEPKDALSTIGSYAKELSALKGAIYFVERKNQIIKQNEYRAISAAVGMGEKAENVIQPQFDELIAQNFRPVAINFAGSPFQYNVLLEKDADIKVENDYRLIRKEFGFNKKINQLGKEGFKPIFIGITFAILQKNRNSSETFSFESADNFNAIVKLLKKINTQGSEYFSKGLSDYECVDPADSNLYFGNQIKNERKQNEYKLLSMVKAWGLKKDETIKVKPTKEKYEEFQSLLKSGYKIRELFYTGEIMILFEKNKDL